MSTIKSLTVRAIITASMYLFCTQNLPDLDYKFLFWVYYIVSYTLNPLDKWLFARLEDFVKKGENQKRRAVAFNTHKAKKAKSRLLSRG